MKDSLLGLGRLAKRRKSVKDEDNPATNPPAGHMVGQVTSVGSRAYTKASKELAAAKHKLEVETARTEKANAKTKAEEENERQAERDGTLQECGCCCIERPMNRMVICENREVTSPHWLCFSCIKTHVETEIGQSRHKIVCIHCDGCTHGFSKTQLRLAVPQQLLDKLDQIQQDDDIRKAELEGLEECPFCDFKAICPPVDVDREFRCENYKCEIVSCRLCHLETHVPLTCEEKAKEKGIDARHAVEEAMTAALVRTCK